MGSTPRREAELGRYELLCLLATGGMAAVHLARAAGIGGFEKLLVVKRILPHAAKDPGFIQMFLDEARIAATLDHANVAHVFDVGSANGDVFLAMEFLHGHDLRSVVRRVGGPLPLDATIAIAVGVCAGLHYAHDRRGGDGQLLGLVHRDVSPSNVVITYDGSVKVIDFGIAKASNRLGETSTGVIKGKPGYMSPEQCLGERELDRRSDVFGVGILLYELTTGTKLDADPAPPSSLVADYPVELERIVLKALRREPEARHQTALELQCELAAFALAERLDLAPTRLAAFMEQTFRDELDAWRAAERTGVSLAEHLVARDQTRRPSHAGATTQTSPAERAEVATAVARPRRRLAAIVAGGIVTGALVAITVWPRGQPTAARAAIGVGNDAATAVAAPPPDLLAAAQAAEGAGKLELAIARYLESYDGHADPQTLVRIGELYERLDRAADAAIYFQRYLDVAPGAHDRDALTARIARLRAPRAVAPTPAVAPTHPVAASPANCQCIISDARHSSGEWMCKRAQPRLCYCRPSHADVGLCPTPLEPCQGGHCTTSASGVGYNCSDPDMGTFHTHAAPGEPCTGYLAGARDPLVPITGDYKCSVCAVFPRTTTWKAEQFGYAGSEGAPCSGFAGDGQALTGHLHCAGS